MKTKDIKISVPPDENPDWDYARNKRVFLRKGALEWSSSVFSSPVELWGMNFIGPNRDSPYEGLTYYLDKSSYKFLDGILFSFENENLKPVIVDVYPNKSLYIYDSSKGFLKAELNVASNKDNDPYLILSLNQETLVSFLIDMRSVYEQGKSGDIIVEADDKFVKIKSKDLSLIIYGIRYFQRKEETLNWHYKYGDGFRERRNGSIKFKGIYSKFLAAGYGIAHEHVIFAPCKTKHEEETIEALLKFEPSTVIDEEQKKLDQLLKSVFLNTGTHSTDLALAGRLLTLNSFGLTEGQFRIPEAGGWWFRNIWARDALEGIIWNMKTYVRLLRMSNFIETTLKFFLSRLDIKDGYLPAIITPVRAGVSADGTLLLFLAIAKYHRLVGETNLFHEATEILKKLVITMKKNDADKEDGPPVLLENSLLATAPNHSWTDSLRHISIDNANYPGFPSRIPDEWLINDIRRLGAENARRESLSPKFLLPEINALWIKVLEEYEIEDIKSKAKTNFLNIFWNWNFINNLVSMKGERDSTVTSMGVMALSLLKHLFNQEQIDKSWRIIKEKLVVHRFPINFKSCSYPFGILVKDSKKRIYFGDDEYHEAVIWPRDIPYMLDLLNAINKEESKKLLINILDESISECAIFYTGELYSLPFGENPDSNSHMSTNPVPVKNQVQYWSHWCDPFIDCGFLTEKI